MSRIRQWPRVVATLAALLCLLGLAGWMIRWEYVSGLDAVLMLWLLTLTVYVLGSTSRWAR